MGFPMRFLCCLVFMISCAQQALASCDAAVTQDACNKTIKQGPDFYQLFDKCNESWQLVFRGTPGTNTSMRLAYKDAQTISVEQGCKQVFSNDPCEHHYRNNDVLDNWGDLCPCLDQVAFVVFKDNLAVQHIVFNATGADYMSWMSHGLVVDSSWTDLKDSTTNVFAMRGEATLSNRAFELMVNYGGCPVDVGWFTASEKVDGFCPWEGDGAWPRFTYSTKSNATQWSTGDRGENRDEADYIAIFVKYF